jgi:hypothetical protein
MQTRRASSSISRLRILRCLRAGPGDASRRRRICGLAAGPQVTARGGTDRGGQHHGASPSPCSPDFNPVENASPHRKALLRKAAERTVAGLPAAIGRLDDPITPVECANMFADAGYDAT